MSGGFFNHNTLLEANKEIEAASQQWTNISDILGGVYIDFIHNYIPGILVGNSGTIYVSTQGIVGLVEAYVTISGSTKNAGCYGIWWGLANSNTLPDKVAMRGGGGLVAVSGEFSGNSMQYFYDVSDDDTGSGFFVNPTWEPYGGSFVPCSSGTYTTLQVKAFAKGGTTYMWKRIS